MPVPPDGTRRAASGAPAVARRVLAVLLTFGSYHPGPFADADIDVLFWLRHVTRADAGPEGRAWDWSACSQPTRSGDAGGAGFPRPS